MSQKPKEHKVEPAVMNISKERIMQERKVHCSSDFINTHIISNGEKIIHTDFMPDLFNAKTANKASTSGKLAFQENPAYAESLSFLVLAILTPI